MDGTRELVFFSYIGKGNNPTRDIELIQELNSIECDYEVREGTEVWVGLEVWLCSEKFMKAVKDVESEEPRQAFYKFPLKTLDGSELTLQVIKRRILLKFEKKVTNQSTKALDVFSGWADIEQLGIDGKPIKFGYFTIEQKKQYGRIKMRNREEMEQLVLERVEVTWWLGRLIPGVAQEHIKWC